MPPSERSAAEDLIQLPRFDASGAVALGEQLLAVVIEGELPRAIQRAKDDLEGTYEALRLANAARLDTAGHADPEAAASSDDDLDTAWSAFFGWLTAFSMLPDGTPQAEEAKTLLAALFPDGLAFTRLPYELQWAQSDERLSSLTYDPLGERARALGGQPFLDAIAIAHRAYSKVLGLRSKSLGKSAPGQAEVHRALLLFTSALRTYALRVTANVEGDEASAAELASALLGPLLSFRGGPARRGDAARGAS